MKEETTLLLFMILLLLTDKSIKLYYIPIKHISNTVLIMNKDVLYTLV